MFLHFLKIAVRNLFKNKVVSLINIFGLAVGFAVCLLIYQYVHFESSYDQFHTNVQNTYRLIQTEFSNGENLGTSSYTTYGLGMMAKENIPEIEDFVRIHPHYTGPIVLNPEKNDPYQEDDLWYVENNFLEMFDFPLKYGERASILRDKHSVVITEHLADKYFGDINPIGKELKFILGDLSGDFTVTGVLKKLPANSHMKFDLLLPIDFLLENYGAYKNEDGWLWRNFITYVSIHETANPEEVEEKFNQLITAFTDKNPSRSNETYHTKLQPVTDIHLQSDVSEEAGASNGDVHNLYFYSLIAVFILLMAWINYINLSTAQAIQRAKEVGVRKSIGAGKGQLVGQFMTESILINLSASTLAVIIAYLLLPVLNELVGEEIEFTIIQNPTFWVYFALASIVGSAASGFYPAFVLSSFKPVSIFSANNFNQKGGFSLRKSLIVSQFFVSILLISGAYLVYQQIMFMKNYDLGIDMEKIIVVQGPRIMDYNNLNSSYSAFKTYLTNHHSILSATGTGTIPGRGNMWGGNVWRSRDLKGESQTANVEQVDSDFSKTFDLKFLAGGPFTKEMVRIGEEGPIIINESAVKTFDLESPEAAINEKLYIMIGDTVEFHIVGVVRDFHWHSLRDGHSANLYALNNEYGAYFSINMDFSNVQETIAHIKASYDIVYPGNPFDYFFLEEDFNRQYQSELQFGNLFSSFSLLALFIACMGLFALVSFSATLKTKEIGVRRCLVQVWSILCCCSQENT
jgi:putative ABC transport system permease protein